MNQVRVIKFISVFLLLVNATGALYGGYSLITQPSGAGLQLPIEFLEPTPFTDYFIPGIILFVFNGIFSLVVVASVIRNSRYSARLVVAQGVILTGWIIVQVLMIQIIYYLQFVLGGVGITLIFLGTLLKRKII